MGDEGQAPGGGEAQRPLREGGWVVDAIGLDKRRPVVGGRYGANVSKQVTGYGAALAILIALVVGFIILAGELDRPPETSEDQAPWSRPDAPQTQVSPLQ